jgi:hypothetical protein
MSIVRDRVLTFVVVLLLLPLLALPLVEPDVVPVLNVDVDVVVAFLPPSLDSNDGFTTFSSTRKSALFGVSVVSVNAQPQRSKG